MIQSMTGFASKNILLTASDNKKASVSVSIKALNGRFFELNCRLPNVFSHLETVILQKIKHTLKRGHVHILVYLANTNIAQGTIEPSLATAHSYVKAIEQIKSACNIDQPISLDHLLRLPNIFNIPEQTCDHALEQDLLQTIDQLAEMVVQARIKEGMGIGQDLQKHTKNLHDNIETIEQCAASFIVRTKEKIQQLLLEIKEAPTETNDIQKNALYALLDKIDIHEEISRFKSHLQNFQSQLTMPHSEKGKLLDFILQELVRETNTINAKCSDATIAKYAIDAKVEIEKMREQVQNIV